MWESTFWLIGFDWCLRIGCTLRVIFRGGPIGGSLAWITIILLIPLLGAIAYVLLSETRLGTRRAGWASRIRQQFQPLHDQLQRFQFDQWERPGNDPAQLSQLIQAAVGNPPLRGNRLELIENAEDIFARLIADIDAATSSCNFEYYIWEAGGWADDLAAALVRATERGVTCRVLVDAVGSRSFLRSKQAHRLRQAGVQIRGALPANVIRSLFDRLDLRLHRKIAVIDQRVAYVGSQNMVDPRFFREGAEYGQWIDVKVRVEGPAVDALAMIFWEDWQLESLPASQYEEVEFQTVNEEPVGTAPVQVIPSGPGVSGQAIHEILLNAIYMADTDLILTTPYFVPDDALQTAILSAARRGVEVTIILPQRVNSLLVRLANRASLRELVEAGVRVAKYQAGLLHTKSIVVDDDTCLIGSLNLDSRSLHLNFEITLTIYDKSFAKSLRELQEHYLQDCIVVQPSDLRRVTWGMRLTENVARLLAPLL